MTGVLRTWLSSGHDLSQEQHQEVEHQHAWYNVMWLTGVDYFSSIAYQAGIALIAAGILAPVATSILVVVTLGCAVPVYREVARRSFAGQGSIALLEHLFAGWHSKLMVLVLLGFAGTDFVITMTLSAADSAQHAVENPLLKPHIGHAHMLITVALLALLAAVFIRGFGEAIHLAVAVAIPYIVLNGIVIARCGLELFRQPALFAHWHQLLHANGQSWTGILIASCFVFPRLALGLSGFETGVSVMPLIQGDPREKGDPGAPPKVRIRNTGRLLLTAAAVMSVLLIGSSIVTTALIPESAYHHGEASGRAMAYLAHLYLGNTFGSVYDFSTILILWFAGASAMAGLLNLIPRYLPRFGMAPHWTSRARPLVLFLFGADLAVTFVFHASVERQGGAYATGVLVLIFSAAVAAALGIWQDSSSLRCRLKSSYFWICAIIFAYTLLVNIRERPDGIIIASIFIALLIITSLLSRYYRATELRVRECAFVDDRSKALWDQLSRSNLNLVPVTSAEDSHLDEIAGSIQRFYRLDGPLTFLHVELLDDRSNFYEDLHVRVQACKDGAGSNYLITAHNANVVANTIAYMSISLKAKRILLRLAKERTPLTRAVRYVLFGTGETGLMVYEILTAYWKERPETDRPLLFLMTT